MAGDNLPPIGKRNPEQQKSRPAIDILTTPIDFEPAAQKHVLNSSDGAAAATGSAAAVQSRTNLKESIVIDQINSSKVTVKKTNSTTFRFFV